MNGRLFLNSRPMEIILKGIVSGLVLALMVGPVFFTIIQTSIERGFKNGVWVAVGVSVSDAFYILLSYLGLSQLVEDERLKVYLTYGGGIMLLIFGFYYLFVKSKKLLDSETEHIKVRSPLRLMAKGFIINGFTPMMLIFWIGTVSVATTDLGYTTPKEVALFFSGIVVTVFTTDVIKAKLADHLRHLLTRRFIRILNIILGIVLLIFGCRLMLFSL